MALDKQIIREYGTYAELTQAAGDKELQMYMIGVANDSDEFVFRSSDGYHRCVDSGTVGLTEHSIPYIDSFGKAAQDNANLQFNQGTGVFTGAIVNASTGFRLNAAATSGQYLRGNGTNIVLSALQSADLPAHGVTVGTLPVSASANGWADSIVLESGYAIGINAAVPLQNIGSASGDTTNINGLHVKSDVDNTRQCMVVIEGKSLSSNGTSHSASSLVFADQAGAANNKIFEFIQSPVAESGSMLDIRVLNDDMATIKNNIMRLDGTNQYITHHHATYDIRLDDVEAVSPGIELKDQTAYYIYKALVNGVEVWIPLMAVLS